MGAEKGGIIFDKGRHFSRAIDGSETTESFGTSLGLCKSASGCLACPIAKNRPQRQQVSPASCFTGSESADNDSVIPHKPATRGGGQEKTRPRSTLRAVSASLQHGCIVRRAPSSSPIPVLDQNKLSWPSRPAYGGSTGLGRPLCGVVLETRLLYPAEPHRGNCPELELLLHFLASSVFKEDRAHPGRGLG